MAEKENRCWPGYEPVPGKKQHSQGSCKPKPDSRSTPAQKKFKAKRRKQLDHWEAEHPEKRPSSAQHLHSPEEKNSSTAKKSKATTKSPPAKTKSASPGKSSATRKRSSAQSRKRTS